MLDKYYRGPNAKLTVVNPLTEEQAKKIVTEFDAVYSKLVEWRKITVLQGEFMTKKKTEQPEEQASVEVNGEVIDSTIVTGSGNLVIGLDGTGEGTVSIVAQPDPVRTSLVNIIAKFKQMQFDGTWNRARNYNPVICDDIEALIAHAEVMLK